MRYRVDHKMPPSDAIPDPRWIYGESTDEQFAVREYRRWHVNGYTARLVSLQATSGSPIETVMTSEQIYDLWRAVERGMNS
jgi:hypothetical protein